MQAVKRAGTVFDEFDTDSSVMLVLDGGGPSHCQFQ